MDIPNQISLEDLQAHADQCKELGIQELTSTELIELAREKIDELEQILKVLNSCQSSTILHSRWRFFQQARQSLRISIRNLKRCIAF